MGESDSGEVGVLGAPGEHARKRSFTALYAMVKRGRVTVPSIGVAVPKCSVAELHERVVDSISRSGGVDDQPALDRLLSLVSYVSGDYENPDTFTAIRTALGTARRPAHYLAIPPSRFETVIKGLGE